MCLPLLFICLSGWVLVSHFISFCLCLASFHLSPRLGACSRVSGRLVSHFLAFVSHFFPQTVYCYLNSFLRRVRPLCHCWCPPISTGHVTFLFIRLPGLLVLVSALSQVCHWWCPPFSAGRVAFLVICLPGLSLLAMQHFYSFVSEVCHLRCRPFPLGMQHFYSFVSQVCHC